MSDTSPSTAPRLFQPLTLLAATLLGLGALAWAGRAVTNHNWHRNFVRFHYMIAPESQYQPTVGEMRAIIRDQCRPDQILVVVGGNSIFQGVGQPVEKLWTRRLQELLGDRYALVNLAFRGSSPTDAGALAAESLRDEFPRQIYLANVPPFTTAAAAGSIDYSFMTLDALHKGWLLDHPERNSQVADRLSRPDLYPNFRELDLGARLDAALRFRELWNWWSATRAFTFPTSLTPEAKRAFLPRNALPDTERDFDEIPFAERYAPRFLETEMLITRNTTAQYYTRTPDGGWQISEFELAQFRKFAGWAFPDRLKARTLIVLSRNSPFYTSKLSGAEQARDELAFRDCAAAWRELGYAATEYGTGFKEDDFGDRTHLTVSGGHKLAARLAPEIRALANKLGYPNP